MRLSGVGVGWGGGGGRTEGGGAGGGGGVWGGAGGERPLSKDTHLGCHRGQAGVEQGGAFISFLA